jgi:putative transposase
MNSKMTRSQQALRSIAHASAGASLDASMHNCRCKLWRWLWRSRQPLTGLIHQPGRGRQYYSNVYVERLLDIGACVSISTPGQPTENAFAESFFKTVKCEEVYVHQYQTFEEARLSLLTILEDVHNAKRLLSSLDYLPPDEFELRYSMC